MAPLPRPPGPQGGGGGRGAPLCAMMPLGLGEGWLREEGVGLDVRYPHPELKVRRAWPL